MVPDTTVFPAMMDEATERAVKPIPWWALGSATFVLLAVLLELVASAWANSPAPTWAETIAPLGWPPVARVVWWLAVAAATAAFHIGLVRAGERPRPVIAALTTGMFVAFAIGIAFAAEWATWH